MTATTPRTPATTTPPPARSNPLGRLGYRLLLDPTLGVITLLVIVCLISAFALPAFLSVGNLTNLVGGSVVVMILAMGMTVVLISGGIDLSIGAVMALCAGVTAQTLLMGMPLIVAFIAALLVGALVGIGNGWLVTRLKLPDFIATLAMLGIASGILYIWTGGVPIIGYMVPEYYYVGGLTPVVGSLTVPMIIALVLALVLGGMLGWTRLGTHLFAVGSSRSAAMQSAVRVDRTRVLAYVISGLTAAVAGIVMAGRNTNVPADLGVGFEIQAIAAAIIGGAALSGGRGRILGAVLGAITLAATINIINLEGVPSSYQRIVIGCILLVAVLANRVSDLVSAAARQRRAAGAGVAGEAAETHSAPLPGSSITSGTSTEGMNRE
ncbi:ABC transporter permease [Blastococcus sp. SYSU D00669]